MLNLRYLNNTVTQDSLGLVSTVYELTLYSASNRQNDPWDNPNLNCPKRNKLKPCNIYHSMQLHAALLVGVIFD